MAWEDSGGPGDSDGTDGDDISGDEANVLGAVLRRLRRGDAYGRPKSPRRIASPSLAQRPTWRTSRLRSFMGMGPVSWGPTVATDQFSIVEPQESFEGKRLIADSLAVGGTSAGIAQVRRIDIGTMPQSPSVEQPAPIAMFRADATYSFLDLQIAYRATKVQITYAITAAPGAGVTLTVSSGFFGDWIR